MITPDHLNEICDIVVKAMHDRGYIHNVGVIMILRDEHEVALAVADAPENVEAMLVSALQQIVEPAHHEHPFVSTSEH